MPRTLQITGHNLTRDDFCAVVYHRRPVRLAPRARQAMLRSRRLVEKMIREKQIVYGVTTGVGSLSTEHIEPHDARRLQLNIVRSHACGVGPPFGAPETRGLLLLRAHGLASGFSGVRPAIVDLLCGFLNRGLYPVVPSRGSVGASGDLAPLAHVGLALVGEGEVFVQEKPNGLCRRMRAAAAMKRSGLKPIQLEAKEGISLVNGTQAMCALGLIALSDAETVVDTADVAGALTLDALRGSPAAFDARFARARPYPGQAIAARHLLRLNQGSAIRESHRTCPRVQDAYSLRCMPQVHGAVRDALGYARKVFEVEMNSATDNPLVFVREGEAISGGNFHGQPLAIALDLMAIALTQLGSISERRVDRMVNPLTSDLPPFLARAPGLESGFMLAQVTAAALASENKILAHPASVDSIPTSGNKEDFVSMGMAAALKLRPVIENVKTILAIELLSACAALDFLAPLETGPLAEKARRLVRRAAPAARGDRPLHNEVAKVAELVSRGAVADVLRK